MNHKSRLWRVDVTNILGYQAPSFYVESSNPGTQTREKAEMDAIKLAKDNTALSRYPKTWKITVTHLENMFQLDGRWVQQRAYKLENGRWVKNRPNS